MKSRLKLLFFFLFVFVCLNSMAFAEQKIVTAEGKYVMGDLDSKKDAKSLALIDAKRLALEQAGVYLEGVAEVKNSQLNKDQISALSAGITSIDIQSEDWKQSGETTSVVLQIKAVTDTANIQDKISRLKESDQVESFKDIEAQQAALQKELADMKAAQKVPEQPVMQKPVQKPAEQPAEQKPAEPNTIKKPPTPEMKQRYEATLNKINALECLGKGNIAIVDQRWNDAVYTLNKAIELNPALTEAYAGKSLAMYNLNQLKEALSVIEQALQLNPESARSLGIKAVILKEQPGKIKAALAVINDAIKLKSTNSRLYRIRGEVYAKMGKIKLAYQDFIAACEMGAKTACEKARKIKR